ncbi:hypothetical protein [Maritimibacter sp. DP1N21-5]|uniref:hypothetical protein n=1 Tax=Maritimibacter sp. DP1N21-5 TaxID=2836867 RepID=UPI001C440BA5|nr:hypothetical protein [Maritimibacter sp. DP1N21-5]MBV7408340.1 hypothetical protein [Maritimibacter sp. DP1N21-5]
MPLGLLAVIVVVGLAAIFAVLYFAGLTRAMELTEATARHEFIADNPPLTPESITLAASRQAALIEAQGLHLLWVMGADVATHRLLGAIPVETPAGLSVHIADYAAPRVSLVLTPDETRDWKTRIQEAT